MASKEILEKMRRIVFPGIIEDQFWDALIASRSSPKLTADGFIFTLGRSSVELYQFLGSMFVRVRCEGLFNANGVVWDQEKAKQLHRKVMNALLAA